MFDTPEGIHTLREFSNRGIIETFAHHNTDRIDGDYLLLFVRMSASSWTAQVIQSQTSLHVCHVSFTLAYIFN